MKANCSNKTKVRLAMADATREQGDSGSLASPPSEAAFIDQGRTVEPPN